MFDNEILSPNEKVKKIRKQILRATQDEIAQGVCKKPNISQIENNKQKLTYFLATGIAENFNRIAKEKNIDIEPITAEYLIKDEDTQANEIFEINILNEIKEINKVHLFEEKLNEAESIIEKYNVLDDKKIQLYQLACNFYFLKHIYTKSDEMCDNGLKLCLNSKNILGEANLYTSKARNYIRKNKYTEALEELDHAERLISNLNDKKLSERICFNKALTYKKLKKYDEAIKYLKILVTKFKIKDGKKFLDIKMLYANCLNDKQKYKEAEKEYISILEPAMKLNDKDFIALTYRNLSELYFNQKNYKDAAISIKESLKHNHGNIHLNHDLYFASKVIKNINEDAEIYLLEALEICEKRDRENYDLIEKIIYELIIIYGDREDEENIDLMLNKIGELNIDERLIYQELSEHYRDIDSEKSKSYNRKSINKSKEIKNF